MTTATPPPSAPARPHLDERATYVPRARVERFIVPLLAREIDTALQRHAASADPGRPRRALDVGCGRQPFRPRLEQLGLTYTSLDTQQNPDTPVDVVAAIDAELPADLRDRGPFDFILCTEVLEHVADWPTAFANLRSLLAPGGRLLLTIPAVYPLHEEPYDFWRPTDHAIREYARRHDLRVVELRRLGTHWDAIGTLVGGLSMRSSGATPWSWLVFRLVRPLRGVVVWLLRTGFLQRHVATRDWVYLSNLAVLERP